MGRHRFGDLQVETKYLGPSPILHNSSVYSVKVSDLEGENWIDRKLAVHGKDRTPALEAAVMTNVLLELTGVAEQPKEWERYAKEVESISQAEIKAVQDLAERFRERLPEAMHKALEHKDLFEEYREAPAGPLDFKISGRKRR
jgi:hypothetical protein